MLAKGEGKAQRLRDIEARYSAKDDEGALFKDELLEHFDVAAFSAEARRAGNCTAALDFVAGAEGLPMAGAPCFDAAYGSGRPTVPVDKALEWCGGGGEGGAAAAEALEAVAVQERNAKGAVLWSSGRGKVTPWQALAAAGCSNADVYGWCAGGEQSQVLACAAPSILERLKKAAPVLVLSLLALWCYCALCAGCAVLIKMWCAWLTRPFAVQDASSGGESVALPEGGGGAGGDVEMAAAAAAAGGRGGRAGPIAKMAAAVKEGAANAIAKQHGQGTYARVGQTVDDEEEDDDVGSMGVVLDAGDFTIDGREGL